MSIMPFGNTGGHNALARRVVYIGPSTKKRLKMLSRDLRDVIAMWIFGNKLLPQLILGEAEGVGRHSMPVGDVTQSENCCL